MDKAKSIKQGPNPVRTGETGRKHRSTNAKYFPGAYWGPSADWMRANTKSTAVRLDPSNYGSGKY